LRLHPPTVAMKKVCTENIEFNLNNSENVTIEKSTTVIIPILSIHRDPQYYENPKAFDPDRFAPKNGGIDYFKEKGVFLAFGDGPRSCIGKSFALAHTKAAVVEILKNFKILQSAETKLPLQMASKGLLNIPLGGLWAVFRPVS
jgi:cytochrome P450